jgi:hypothetical protein
MGTANAGIPGPAVRTSIHPNPRRNRFELTLSGSNTDLTGEPAIIRPESRGRESSKLRPHSSLGYRPPAPEAREPGLTGLATLSRPVLALGLT